MKWSFNQVIANNLRIVRESKGLTQEAACRATETVMPGGKWTPTVWSAAERSIVGRRIRKFDADEIAALSMGLGVSVAALFLPPDGESEISQIIAEGAENGLDAAHMLALASTLDKATESRIRGLAIGLGTELSRLSESSFATSASRQVLDVVAGHLKSALDALATLSGADTPPK